MKQDQLTRISMLAAAALGIAVLSACTALGAGTGAGTGGGIGLGASDDDAPRGSDSVSVSASARRVVHRPMRSQHASAIVSEHDPALVERADLLVEIVRIETAALRDRLDTTSMLDAVTLSEIERLNAHADRVEAALARCEDVRDRRALADATTRLRSTWNAFQLRLADQIRVAGAS